MKTQYDGVTGLNKFDASQDREAVYDILNTNELKWNKIGTYAAALAAHAHGVPFYVAAPTSTLDPATPSGDAIEIEERSPEEVLFTWGWDDDGRWMRVRASAEGSPARNPAFDVTPARLITGILTERGLIPATEAGVRSVAR